MSFSVKRQPPDHDKDKSLTSIYHLAHIVDTLRQEDDVIPDFQRVTITGEETSGVSQSVMIQSLITSEMAQLSNDTATLNSQHRTAHYLRKLITLICALMCISLYAD